jgi:hypothetical protein
MHLQDLEEALVGCFIFVFGSSFNENFISNVVDWQLFHFDVHNAFQSTPDPGDIHRNRAYLKINRECLEFIKLHKPEWWDQVKNLLSKHTVGELAGEMFMFIQGRVDASLMWAIEVEEFLSSTLKPVVNRADPCVYSGIVNGEPVILGRATDDFLCACEKQYIYDYIVEQFCRKWKIHALVLFTSSLVSILLSLQIVSLLIKLINVRKS